MNNPLRSSNLLPSIHHTISQLTTKDRMLLSVQISRQNFQDYGIDPLLDDIQKRARANAILFMPWGHSHLGDDYVHPFPLEPAELADCGLPVKAGKVVADADYMSKVEQALRDRGMRLQYAMIETLGIPHELLENIDHLRERNPEGGIEDSLCMNNPETLRVHVESISRVMERIPTAADLCWFQERQGPLTALLRGRKPVQGRHRVCFCEHCRAKARAKGLDPDEAARGLTELLQLLNHEGARPTDGWFIEMLRLIYRYPAVVAWDAFWWQSMFDFRIALGKALREARPGLQIGWHIDHSISFSPISRAANDYAMIAEHCDFIKPVAYHGCAGVRARKWWQEGYHKTPLFREQPFEHVYEGLMNIFGYDQELEPGPPTWLGKDKGPGFSSAYVGAELARAVAVAGDTPVYGGIGIGIPPAVDVPESIYEVCRRSFQTGVQGLMISREYSEMDPECLSAVGKAVEDATATR